LCPQKSPANPVFISFRGFFSGRKIGPLDWPEGHKMPAREESLPSYRFFEHKIAKVMKGRQASHRCRRLGFGEASGQGAGPSIGPILAVYLPPSVAKKSSVWQDLLRTETKASHRLKKISFPLVTQQKTISPENPRRLSSLVWSPQRPIDGLGLGIKGPHRRTRHLGAPRGRPPRAHPRHHHNQPPQR